MDYTVHSNQAGVHESLSAIVEKHKRTAYQSPISPQQQQAFATILPSLKQHAGHLIIDAGCGTGMSTIKLSKQHPQHFILGIDKSEHRLARHEKPCDNMAFLRADLIAFFQQALTAKLHVDKLYFLYPNPWPKAKHLQRRFHGHAIFPTILQLSNNIEVRSNWHTYLEEFAIAAKLLKPYKTEITSNQPKDPISLFEKKYLDNHCSVYCLQLTSQ